jgi:long-chain acyl-CoA synthetase
VQEIRTGLRYNLEIDSLEIDSLEIDSPEIHRQYHHLGRSQRMKFLGASRMLESRLNTESSRQAMVRATQNLVQMAAQACATHSHRIAYTCLGADLRYGELDAFSTAFAQWLLEQRLQPGDRVALLLPNLLQYPVAALGVLKAGGVIVNMNPLYTALELEQQLNDSGAKFLVVLANIAHVVARVVAATRVEQVVVTEVGDLHPWYRRLPINLMLKHVRRAVAPFHFPQQAALRAVLDAGRRLRHALPEPAADSLAVLQYTGGTTGKAKAAMLSHRNLGSNTLQVAKALDGLLPVVGAVMVAPLPLYHIYAFTMNFLTSIVSGHRTLLIPNPRDIPAFARALKPFRVDGFAGINTLYKALCGNANFCALDFSALRVSSSGGMALEPAVARRWEAVTGCVVLEGYGLTECAPMVTCNLPGALRPGSAGRAAPGTELAIKDKTGRTVPVGEAGEVCIKGPQVMQGYWQQPDETASVFDADGWLHSGDIGILDAEGYLRIVDRIKDLIIISGFNVYPNEIEDHVCAHPAVAEAAVIGIGDEYSMRIALFVVRRDSALTEDNIIAWCREGLAPYKVPKVVEFRNSLPKSNVGKVLRRELRTTAGDGT